LPHSPCNKSTIHPGYHWYHSQQRYQQEELKHEEDFWFSKEPPNSFPSMSEASSALFISHPCVQFWTPHFCFYNFVFFAHVLSINLPETFSINRNPKSLVCVVFVTYSSGFFLLASDSLFR
jgi:hypothetical protein